MEYLIWFGWPQPYASNELYGEAVEFVEHGRHGKHGRRSFNVLSDLWSPLSCKIAMILVSITVLYEYTHHVAKLYHVLQLQSLPSPA